MTRNVVEYARRKRQPSAPALRCTRAVRAGERSACVGFEGVATWDIAPARVSFISGGGATFVAETVAFFHLERQPATAHGTIVMSPWATLPGASAPPRTCARGRCATARWRRSVDTARWRTR